MLFTATALVALLHALPALAHLALWDPSVFGWTDDPNQSDIVTPLDHLPFDEWWYHGKINQPPKDGVFMELPAGGSYHGQIACNKALTKYGQNDYQQHGIYACEGDGPEGGIGAMHTSDAWQSSNPVDVKGTGLSIAYKSDHHAVKPEDFTVISTDWLSPWFKNVEYKIPSDLPACPEGGCICMWGWIHSADAGSEQNYVLMYRCKVTGATETRALPPAKTANKCHYPVDTSNCTVGAKQPHFWYQLDHNNNPQGTYDPPFYNGEYGYMNGAQTDLFAGVAAAPEQQPVASAGSSVSVSSASSAAGPSVAANSGAESAEQVTPPSSSFSVTPPSSTPASSSLMSTPSPVTAAPAASAFATTKNCRRRRALERLADPEVKRRHEIRARKRALRKRGARSWNSREQAQ